MSRAEPNMEDRRVTSQVSSPARVSGADAGVGKELCKIPDLIKSQFIVAEAG